MHVRSLLCAAVALLVPAFVQAVEADAAGRGLALTREMEFSRSFAVGLEICREKARDQDVPGLLVKSPDMFGGIKPGDADWAEAERLYLRMLERGCAYDMDAAEQAFAHALETALDESELDALLAFYRSDLGRRYVLASHAANRASGRAADPLPEAHRAYDDYAEALQALLARRPAAANAPLANKKPHVSRPLASADEAVSFSDRMMKLVSAGKAREALALVAPHSIMDQSQIEGLIRQMEEHLPTFQERYGSELDHELLRNDNIGDSIIRNVYLQRRERHAVSWQFVWYRGKDGWFLVGARYADDLASLFR